MKYIQAFKWIYARLQSHRKRQFWVLFLVMVLSAMLETAAVAGVAFFASVITDPEAVLSSKYVGYIRQVVDTGFLADHKKIILVSSMIVVSLIVLKNGFKACVTYWITRFGFGVEAFFGEILLGGFLSMPYQWHQKLNSADLVNSIQWRNYLGSSFFGPCLTVFNNVLMVGIMLAALLIAQPLISLTLFIVIGLTAYFIYTIMKRKIDQISTISRDYQLLINKEATMAIHGIKDVKICQKEKNFIEKFLKNAIPLSKIKGLSEFYGGSPVLILESVGFIMLCLSIIIMLFWEKASTAYTTGTMTLLAVTAWRVLPAVNQILGQTATARASLPFISSQMSYINLIESNEKIVEYDTNSPAIFSSHIKFNNVCFSYDETRQVISNLSFEIRKGETIGVIGTSGAGKSTLVDLLIGLLKPVKGNISIDDRILSNDLIPYWLSITGYVPQSPYIYDGTLAENVAFGLALDHIDNHRVRECCRMAAMDNFIGDLPGGIESHIGERGIKLSGGQQQRVAIARALYGNPEVMIFDEATSSLDTRSEKAIQKTIYSFKGKQTLILIAHRLTTIEDCDRVIWIEKGRIKMIGPPKSILKLYDTGTSPHMPDREMLQ